MGDMPSELKVLRVTQLDASLLDSDLLDLLKNQFSKTLKYCRPSILASIQPELDAFIHLLVWRFSLYTTGSTVGQDLLDVQYMDKSLKSSISCQQKIAYAALLIGGSYLADRQTDIFRLTALSFPKQILLKASNWAEMAIKTSILLNFCVFLCRGEYQLVLERLLGIKALFRKPQNVRQLSYDYTNREILWHGFSEFLLFLLPFINFRHLRNSFKRMMMRQTPSGGISSTPKDLDFCLLCRLPPCVPHCIGCRHVFCYYCIMGNILSDPAFACPECGVKVDHINSATPVLLLKG